MTKAGCGLMVGFHTCLQMLEVKGKLYFIIIKSGMKSLFLYIFDKYLNVTLYFRIIQK